MNRAALIDGDVVPPESTIGRAVVLRQFRAGDRALRRGDLLGKVELLAMRNWRALVKCQFVEINPPPAVTGSVNKGKLAK